MIVDTPGIGIHRSCKQFGKGTENSPSAKDPSPETGMYISHWIGKHEITKLCVDFFRRLGILW